MIFKMTCPHCGKRAISFRDWGRGLNAFRTNCRSCGVSLQATKGTYFAALVCFAMILYLIFQLAPAAEASGMSRFTFKEVVIGSCAFVIVGLASRFCGYQLANRPAKSD